MRIRTMLVALACAATCLAIAAGSAQAATGVLPGATPAVKAAKPAHLKGYKEYELCTYGECSTHMAIDAKTRAWYFPEYPEYYGSFIKYKKGYELFIYEGEGSEAECYIYAKKTKTGLSSEAAPGIFECPGEEFGYAIWARKL
jgi:hypothetical protein